MKTYYVVGTGIKRRTDYVEETAVKREQAMLYLQLFSRKPPSKEKILCRTNCSKKTDYVVETTIKKEQTMWKRLQLKENRLCKRNALKRKQTMLLKLQSKENRLCS